MKPESKQLNQLLARLVDETIEADELTELEALLDGHPEAQDQYFHYLGLHNDLQSSQHATLPNDKLDHSLETRSEPIQFPQWRPLATAVAAGVAIGLFCASVAWAIVSPDQQTVRLILPLLSESFESPTTALIDHFPTRLGEWGGESASIVASPPGDSPLHGDRVLSLDTAADSNLGYLQQIIDVSGLPLAEEGEMRTVEAIASFHSQEPGELERYTLRLASFRESPGAIRELWEGTSWREMDANTLTTAKAGLTAPSDARGWQTISAVVEVPADARSLVISLAAGRLDPTAPKTPHYLDDVRADLVISPRVKRIRPKKR